MSELEDCRNLLIVDDEKEILKALRRLFRKEYKVFIANSGQEALEILREHRIPVIISDQGMPGLTGAELLSRVESEFPDATRLLVTGYADINAVIQAINEGRIFRYIAKPWDPEELLGIVSQAFERYRLILKNRKLLDDLRAANAELESKVEERTAELKAANDELARLNELKDDFLRMAAHDLRNPLGSVLGFSELLLAQAEPQSKTERRLKLIHGASETMLKLVNELLDFSRIQEGKLEIAKEPVALRTFAERIHDLYEGLASAKDLQLETRLPETEKTFEFDPTRIEQVIGNLLGNAFKFSPRGSTVKLGVDQENGAVEFSVTDSGPGIPPEEAERIFEAYHQTSARPTGSEKGLGLGLSISQSIVEGHGGEIGVESAPGKGSRFYFRIPV